jgi:predicted secreted protein
MNLVKGQDISISLNNKILACWRSSTLQITTDTIGKSTVGSGNWKEFEAVVNSWTVSGEGLIYNDATFTIHDAFDLQAALTEVFIIFAVVAKDAAGTVLSQKVYYGTAIITNIQEQGNVNDNGSFNLSLQGTGELNKANTANFGNYPEDFQVIDVDVNTPVPGQSTLHLVWNAATPTPDEYKIKMIDNTTSTTTYVVGPTLGNTVAVVVDDSHTYTFSIASVYDGGLAISDYSPTINYP